MISWKSGNQPTVSRSFTEVEYQSLVDAAVELNWTESMIREMGINLKSPLRLAYDNLVANYLARNPIHHGKAKHVAISYHFIREQVVAGSLVIEHVCSKDQPADVLTKPLPMTSFTHMRNKLIYNLSMTLRRGVSSVG